MNSRGTFTLLVSLTERILANAAVTNALQKDWSGKLLPKGDGLERGEPETVPEYCCSEV